MKGGEWNGDIAEWAVQAAKAACHMPPSKLKFETFPATMHSFPLLRSSCTEPGEG